MTRHYIIPIFVPHFGCPHNCVFCNQRKITGLSTDVTISDVRRIIDEHLETFKKDSFVEVAFFGGSFTAIEREIQAELLSIPYEYKKIGKIDNIRLSTRPDAIDDGILELLEKYSVDTIELGVQSLDTEVLYLSERGHSIEDVHNASNLIRKWGFKLGHQLMLGLPGDTREKSFTTAREILSIKPDMIRIYPTLVIRNTALETMMKKGSYKPIGIEEAIETSAEILMAFTVEDIPVIRIGLQPTDNIQMGKDVVAGPFHPAFRQLVEENVLRKLVTDYFRRSKVLLTGKNISIRCSNSMTSVVAGQHGKNREMLKKLLGVCSLKIIPERMAYYNIIINVEETEIFIDLKNEMEIYTNKNPL
ncbi:MAG: elongator complex protein 3 [Bacillota bacterium]